MAGLIIESFRFEDADDILSYRIHSLRNRHPGNLYRSFFFFSQQKLERLFSVKGGEALSR